MTIAEDPAPLYPILYVGDTGLELRAVFIPGKSGVSVSRVSIERTDGEALIIGQRRYPAGFIAVYGDPAAISFHDQIKRK